MKAMNMTSSFSNRREDSPKTLESAEQAFDLIASLVHGAIVFPRRDPILFGRNNRDEPKIECELPGFISFVCPIHQQMQRPGSLTQIAEQLATLGRIVGLAGRQCKRYGRSSIRGNHMNLGGPSSTGFANGLGAVFFSAPVPSGCTLTAVLSNATASILMRTI